MISQLIDGTKLAVDVCRCVCLPLKLPYAITKVVTCTDGMMVNIAVENRNQVCPIWHFPPG